MTVDRTELVGIRDALPSDHNFIMATWLRGLYYGQSWFSEIPKDIFMGNYHNFLETILKSPNTSIKVACLKDDTDVILGYSVLSSAFPTAHWCFVKAVWRGIGIAKLLVPKDTKTFSHVTKTGLSIIRNHPGVIFNPFSI